MITPEKSDVDIRERSPLALAFLGDGVLELLVRNRLVAVGRMSPGAMHTQAVRMVSAHGQSAALETLQPHLTEKENEIVRRGRNANKASVSKHATVQEYRASTGLEALFGWLYLQNEQERIEELFDYIWQWYLSNEGKPVKKQ